jgi:hypothetical protein
MFKELMKCVFLIGFCFSAMHVAAQKKVAIISGKVIDENDKAISNVTVQVLNIAKNTITNDSGYFKIEVQPNKAVALVFSFTGYNSVQKTFTSVQVKKRK